MGLEEGLTSDRRPNADAEPGKKDISGSCTAKSNKIWFGLGHVLEHGNEKNAANHQKIIVNE